MGEIPFAELGIGGIVAALSLLALREALRLAREALQRRGLRNGVDRRTLAAPALDPALKKAVFSTERNVGVLHTLRLQAIREDAEWRGELLATLKNLSRQIERMNGR